LRNPTFKDEEIDRLRRQYSTAESVSGYAGHDRALCGRSRGLSRRRLTAIRFPGTPESLPRIKRDDIVRLHDKFYRPDNAVLIIGGDISPENGFALAQKYLGDWPKPATELPGMAITAPASEPATVAFW